VRSAKYGRAWPQRQLVRNKSWAHVGIMSKLHFAIGSVLFLVLSSPDMSADSSPSPKPASETGIEGTIFIGPVQAGPTRQGVPDSKPLANTDFQVKVQSGVVASFKTDDEGRFRITLPAGHYTVSRKDSVASIGNYSFEVEVTAGQMKRVHWECDSGIR
jgi:hypothetical protein